MTPETFITEFLMESLFKVNYNVICVRSKGRSAAFTLAPAPRGPDRAYKKGPRVAAYMIPTYLKVALKDQM